MRSAGQETVGGGLRLVNAERLGGGGSVGCGALTVIEFRVLGSFEAVDGDRVLALGTPRQRALLAVLVLHRGEPVSSERLIDELWGEQAPASAIKIVQGYVSNLRKVLTDGLLVTCGHGYLLQTEPGQIDVDRFESLVAEGRHALRGGDARTAVARLRGALGLWRGPPLADFAYETFAQAEIARLEERRLVVLEQRIDAELALEDPAALVAELAALAREHPLRERVWGQLMLALYRAGRQGEALEAYQHAREQLADELGLEPGPALKTLQVQILEQAPELQASAPPRDDAQRLLTASAAAGDRRALPRPPTSLIGREPELATVCGLLEGHDARLVTLTGPGGVGKTRLALEVAHVLQSSLGDGVGWVELAGVARPDEVEMTIARALPVTPLPGESPREALCRHLAGKRLLLAIDNFEHVLEAAELVAELHAACPDLALLVTSREPLSLAAEHRVFIAPLAVPAIHTATAEEIESTSGSALFLAAARRRDSSFTVNSTAAHSIAQICARLDGLPLALELAAARTGVLSVEELAARLGEAVIDLGVGPRDAPDRQRTLHATIEWSYRTLDKPLQRAFVTFAIFAGGATVEAACAVTGADLGTIEALIAKSLIYRRRQPGGATRLLMLETIRQYALEQLAGDAGQAAVHQRHCDYYLQLAEHAVPRLSTRDEDDALAVLDAEIHNLRTALQWALEASPETSLRLAGQLGNYWQLRPGPEGLHWLDAALRAAGEAAPLTDRARARLHQANQLGFRGFRNEGAAAIDGLQAALALYRQVDDHVGISETLSSLAVTVGVVNDDQTGEREHALEACRHARIAGDDRLLGRALGRLAAVAGNERSAILEHAAELLTPLGDHRAVVSAYSSAAYVALSEDHIAEAISLLDTALRAVGRIKDPHETAIVLSNIGLARLFSGELDPARDAFERALRLCAEHAFRENADEGLAGLAAVAAAQGRDETAARLQGAAHALGYPPATFDKKIDDRLERDYLAAARTRYGDIAWRAAQQTGGGWSRDQAIAYALGAWCKAIQLGEGGGCTSDAQRLDDPPGRPTAGRGGRGSERLLTTVMFTDIVGSTAHAADLGDRRWRALLDSHDAVVRAELSRAGGVEIKLIGDGLVATFNGPARAIDCACAMRDAVRMLGVVIRVGIHTGEIELRDDDIGGIGVHISARVAALARPAEILVSQTVTELVAGSGIRFDERGPHELKGVPGSWRLYSVRQPSDRHIGVTAAPIGVTE
jgi:predicted ATPase/DNA-binding SARP family transcriptional activator/class 3 adenylate cyclase